MRNLKEKFKRKINFVKPLYRKVNPNTKILKKSGFTTLDTDNKSKLWGHGNDGKRNATEGKTNVNNAVHNHHSEHYKIILPGVCQRSIKADFNEKQESLVRNIEVGRIRQNNNQMIGIFESTQEQNDHNQVYRSGNVHKLSDTWLRVYPAPMLQDESVYSVIVRCFMCQMGLSTFLFLWTLCWVLVIHYFEGPFEKRVSMDFKEQQSQLVIDLATELRQITPISPKWRKAIEERIEAERQLTIAAVGRGARLHPGHFWDVPGTFLFTIYVMTALGFGAPVPQTLWGRSATLIYAIVAVPSHIYLMVHLSTCVVVHVEYNMRRLRLFFRDRVTFDIGKCLDNKKDSPNCSRNSELKPNRSKLRRRIICILGIFCVGRGVPLATALYYVIGLTTFGLARSKQTLEVVMFPLEFTTTGGLEHVECYVRILYGIYVEGAMILLSCALATLRRHSSGSVTNMADRYRLFAHEQYSDCDD